MFNSKISLFKNNNKAGLFRMEVPSNFWRLLFISVVFFFCMLGDVTRDATFRALQDAFLQVTVFVAGTLALVYWFEKRFDFDLGHVMANSGVYQPIIASLLGALPGCGGAIIVVTQFTRGYVRFGSFVAVLVSTMGDAAFLLMAREPKTALFVVGISISCGAISGIIADWFHGDKISHKKSDSKPLYTPVPLKKEKLGFRTIWAMFVTIGLPLGLMIAFQFNPEELFGHYSIYEPVKYFAVAGALLSLFMWAISQSRISQLSADSTAEQPLLTRIIKDTNFVSSWVIMAFLIFEISVSVFNINLSLWFKGMGAYVPLIAILIGFIPGCGPQILVTSLYLNGIVPFSAQIANAIANDGDALFPALALTPRAAILATIYSAIPALIIGYFFFFFPGFAI